MTQDGGASYVLPNKIREGTLHYLLSNHLILCHTIPYLPIADVLNLAATSRTFRALVYETPHVFRHLDLTHVKSAQFDIPVIDSGGETWRNVQLDENLTEDDFYSGPLRGIFNTLSRSQILRQVQTLILDGLAVTAELVHEILVDPTYNVRILSLRDAKHLNERALCRALRTACRPSRPDSTPKLKALYIFSPREEKAITKVNIEPLGAGRVGTDWNARSLAALSSLVLGDHAGEGDAWYNRKGKMLTRTISSDWASTLLDCRGVIAFDAVLCNGPRHHNSPAFGMAAVPSGGSPFTVATHALGGCEHCGSAPEGWAVWGDQVSDEQGGDLGRFPLLSPPPMLSSNVRAAMCPTGQSVNPSRFMSGNGSDKAPRFIARCLECLRDRYCWTCQRWWCEACFPGSISMTNAAVESELKARVSRSCWECGINCHDCISSTQLLCKGCCGGYCIIHNEGSTLTMCDWCQARGRRIRHY